MKVKNYILNKGWLVGVGVISSIILLAEFAVAAYLDDVAARKVVSCTVEKLSAPSSGTLRMHLACEDGVRPQYLDDARVALVYINTPGPLSCRVGIYTIRDCEVRR